MQTTIAHRISTSLIFLLMLVPLSVPAQIQKLPTIELGSDASLVMPLVRKQVEYPTGTVSDTLDTMLPPVLKLKRKQPVWVQKTRDSAFFDLSMYTSAKMDFAISYYPRLSPISLLSTDLSHHKYANESYRTELSAQARHLLANEFYLNHALSHSKASTDSMQSQLNSYSLYGYVSVLKAGGLSLVNADTRIGLETWEQNLPVGKLKDWSYNLIHSSRLNWGKHSVAAKLVLLSGKTGLDISYKLPLEDKPGSNYLLGLMTDMHSFYPSFSAVRRFALSKDLTLGISNTPYVRSYPRSYLNNMYPWASQAMGAFMALSPLNVEFSVLKAVKGSNEPLQLSYTQNLRWENKHPMLSYLDQSAITEIVRQELFTSTSVITASFVGDDIKFVQNISLHLDFLPEENWKRMPYSAVIKAESGLGLRLGAVDLELDLEQRYFQRDEDGRHLPEVVDLGFALNYPFLSRYRFTLGISNLFNSKYHDHGRIPGMGRRLYLSFRMNP